MSPLLRAALTPAALTWAAGVRLHRAVWQGRRYRAPCPVVSVGALAMGGSGKTPMAWWVARALVDLGAERVLLVARGHGRRRARSAPAQLIDPALDAERLRVDEVGDEAAMLAVWRRAAGPPWRDRITIGVSRRRDRVIEAARAKLGRLDAIVLDDALQHHRVARDLDLVLVAPDVEDDRVFPAGRLREPLTSLPRGAVVQMHAGDGTSGMLVGGALPIDVRSRNVLRRLIRVTGAHESRPASSWSGRPVVLVSAVGRNDNVRRLVDRAGVAVVEHLARPDHARFTTRELAALAARTRDAAAWLTTAKDWPRLREVLPHHAPPVWVLDIELDVTHGAEMLRERLRAL